MASYALQTPHRVAHGKPPWPKEEKLAENLFFFLVKTIKTIIIFCIYLLVMPKYWGNKFFSIGGFPEVGQKQKTEGKKRKREIESW